MIKKIVCLFFGLLLVCCVGCKSKDIEVGNLVSESISLSENDIRYTPETLPDEYIRDDFDGDGLRNDHEIERGTDMYKSDTDGDGIGDLDEIEETKTDPTKYSSRNDNVSDLDWWFSKGESFEEGWSATGASGFKVYLTKPADRIYSISKVNTDKFDELDTITEAYQIKDFSGKIALNCSQYTAEVHLMIDVYILRNNEVHNAEVISRENGLIAFDVEKNDIFVAVCEPRQMK